MYLSRSLQTAFCHPGVNPTTVSYNATCILVRFENKNVFATLKKSSSLLRRWGCSRKFRSRRIGSCCCLLCKTLYKIVTSSPRVSAQVRSVLAEGGQRDLRKRGGHFAQGGGDGQLHRQNHEDQAPQGKQKMSVDLLLSKKLFKDTCTYVFVQTSLEQREWIL
jgi:hypothetical protein